MTIKEFENKYWYMSELKALTKLLKKRFISFDRMLAYMLT